MGLTEAVQIKLKAAGFQHHSFVSWPHSSSPIIREFAEKLHSSIEAHLGTRVPNPSIFMDKENLTGGDAWEKTLARALCKSVTMVAVCSPIYYHSSHAYCGREWKAAEILGKSRFPKAQFGMIIPALVRKSHDLPPAIASTQYVDFSSVAVRARYYNTNDFRRKVEEIVDRIEEAAEHLAKGGAAAACTDYLMPIDSAFAAQHQAAVLPFREGA